MPDSYLEYISNKCHPCDELVIDLRICKFMKYLKQATMFYFLLAEVQNYPGDSISGLKKRFKANYQYVVNNSACAILQNAIFRFHTIDNARNYSYSKLTPTSFFH